MNDLLGTVKTNALYGSPDEDDEFEDVEANIAPPPSEAEREMQEFFKKVEGIKTDLAEIKFLQKDVETMNEKGKTIVKPKEMQKHREDMQVRAYVMHMLCI